MDKPINKSWAIFTGLLAFVLGLIAMAPASLISDWAYRQSAGHVQLTQANGTVWNGHAILALQGNNAGETAAIGTLRWEISPLQLLLGKGYAVLYWNDAPPAWLTMDTKRWHIEHAAMDFPASALARFVPAMQAAQLQGQINIHAESLIFTPDAIQGEILIDWMQASSPLSAVSPLGDYRLSLKGEQNSLAIALTTLEGALVLDGSGMWSPGSGLRFEGNAKAAADQEKPLADLLRILGNEQVAGSGNYRISLQAR